VAETLLTKELIKGLVGSCLVKGFDGSKPVPLFHEEMWDLCCSPAKYVAIAAPRGHAKSTAISFSYTLAAVLFRERRFVVIVSDSEFQASMFLGQIKQALQENEDIIKLFHIKRNEKGLVEFEKETETDIIVATEDGYKFRIIAKGSEQKMRGLLWNGQRPDLFILDDMESDEQVMNKERRSKFERWFYGALIPALSENGIIRYVGTILHQDAMLEKLMPKPGGIYVIEESLKMYKSKYAGFWHSVKYRAHSDDFSDILWPDRWDKKRLKETREEYAMRGLMDKYSQEFLNIPIDESTAFLKRGDFLPETAEDKKKNLNYYITGDFAISERERADYTVFVIGGMDDSGILHIKNVVRDRMGGEEIVQTMLGLQKVYNPIAFGIEEMQVSKALGPYLNRAMVDNNVYINLVMMKPYRADKITRAQSIRARMRAGGVKFDKSADWYQALEDEATSFPRAKHDDQVDALAYLGLLLDRIIDAPTEAELADQEYDEEVNSTGNHLQGRSPFTGY
jgi:predicted phage terminase large subunit-like protein